jgi:hypothetical protein
MRFWTREIAGWALVGLGLFVFYLCLGMLLQTPAKLIEAAPATFIGFIIFRGGIHLLKVAVAARICSLAAQPAARPAAVSVLGGRPTTTHFGPPRTELRPAARGGR